MDFLSLDLSALSTGRAHAYLLGSIGPRPICFASTVDREGRPNLAPFSYFNVFSTRPPVLGFSPSRSGRTGAHKDTMLNLQEVPEVVVNVVTYSIVQQMNLASGDYARGVNEFEKAGFSPLAAEVVRPARVAESPIQLECRVRDIIVFSEEPAGGNLVLADVLRMHVRTDLLDAEGNLDTTLTDLVGRMGADYYARAHGEALFRVPRPVLGIGIDGLPPEVRNSPVLTGNDLGMLGNIEVLPTAAEVKAFVAAQPEGWQYGLVTAPDYHRAAQVLLKERRIKEAWCVLLAQVAIAH